MNGGGKMKGGSEVIITWTLMTIPQFLTHTHSQHLTMSKCHAELESTEMMLKYCVRERDVISLFEILSFSCSVIICTCNTFYRG